jgi:energy-coupling factor transporter ATP-binding protein EcfA2
MPDYLIFGNCLRSELAFPELVVTRDQMPRWTLRLGALSPHDDGEVLADSQLSPSCRVRISQRGTTLRFFHSCSGTFEMSKDGTDIVFDAAHAVNTDVARSDLVARLLLTFADHDRVTWLHGSAARVGGSAVAFVGRSGAGKSTLALALARNGARHICDDTLPIEAGNSSTEPSPVVWPSDQTIRLHADSKAYLAENTAAARRESDGKFILTHGSLGPDTCVRELQTEPFKVPLAAVYVLSGTADGGSVPTEAIERKLIEPRLAVGALLQHLRLGTVIERSFASKSMRQLAAVVGAVPVYQLRLVRDWSAIDSVARRIIAWHTSRGRDITQRHSA